MAATAEDRFARVLKRLALAIALAVAIGLPAEYIGLHYYKDADHIDLAARIKAEHLAELAAANPREWVYDMQRIEELLVLSPPALGRDRATIRDAAGNSILAMGGFPRAPVLVRSYPIHDSERLVGRVEITHSFREALSGSLLATLLGVLLGVLVYATLSILPLRALRRMGVALSAREQRFQTLFDRATDGIMVVNASGRIVGVNESFARMHGYRVEEMRNMTLENLDAPETRDLVRERVAAMSSGEPIIFEAGHYHKDGHVFPLEVTASLFETDGETLIQAFHRDITERKEAALELARQKDLYDMLSQTNQAIVRITNRDELFPAVCRIAVEHGRFLFAWIGLVDATDPRLKPIAKFGADAGYIDQVNFGGDVSRTSRQGLTGRTILSGGHVISNDFLNDGAMAPWHEAAERAGVRAAAKFPIREQGSVIGAINLYARDTGFFTEQLVATLDEMAIDISFALDNYAREAARLKAEEALREGEIRYRRMFEANPYPMWVVDTETLRFLAVNDAAVARYGWSREEFLAMTSLDIRPADDIAVFVELVAANKGKRFSAASSRHRKKDGTIIRVDIATHAIEFGGRNAWIVAAIDITERQQMEEQLRDSIAFRESLLQAMPLPVFHKDAEGRYTGCNIAFAEFIGKAENDIVGRTVHEVSPQNLALTYRDKDLELLDGPVAWQQYESQVMHADGTAHDVIFHKARIVDRAGRPSGIVGAITDITERKQMEQALRAAEEQFRGLVEQEVAGIYIIQDGAFVYVNPRFAAIRGYDSADELIGCDVLPLIAEKDRAVVAENNRRLLSGEMESVDFNFTGLCKDGSSIEIGVHSALASYRGRPAIIGLMQDISEKKRAEDQIQHYVAQLKNAFMQSVEVATMLSLTVSSLSIAISPAAARTSL